MKKGLTNRFRGVALAGTVAAALAVMGACNGVQDNLLEQQQPQVILPNAVTNATGALGQYTGALGLFRTALNGHNNNQETIWNFAGLMTDEFKSGDTFSQRNDADERQTQPNDGVSLLPYDYVQQARGFARSAINALLQYSPVSTYQIGEMYMEMGFMEMTLGQDYCGYIPLGETVGGVPAYTAPLTRAQVFAQASARLDSALSFNTAADAYSVSVRQASALTKARIQVDLGNLNTAAKLVGATGPAGNIPTTYQYLITYSVGTQSNEFWQMGHNTKRYTVADSFDVTGQVVNSIPFAANGVGTPTDPRLPLTKTAGAKSFDNVTPFYDLTTTSNWGQFDAVALVAGLDARLIEAEWQLNGAGADGVFNAGTPATWTVMVGILNALRTGPTPIGKFTPAAMAALPVPATQAAATALFFREKAYWQFGRGERLGDLRRQMYQYGQTEHDTYPGAYNPLGAGRGAFHKGAAYGTNVVFPVPANAGTGSETANPLYDPTKCDPTKP